MSEQQHTPGPWLIDVDNYHAGHIASVATADGPGPRFEVWSMNWPKQEQCEANARLIAAAPELLEALKRLLGATGEGNAQEHEPGCGCVIHEARAAIAKATCR